MAVVRKRESEVGVQVRECGFAEIRRRTTSGLTRAVVFQVW